jgi:hypothetical protein
VSHKFLLELQPLRRGKGKEKAKEEREAEPTLLLPDLSEDVVFPQLPEVSDDGLQLLPRQHLHPLPRKSSRRNQQQTQADIDQSRFQDELMDNIDLQPDQLLRACDQLGIKDLRALRIKGMRANRQLKYWQVTAVERLEQFMRDRRLRGAMLCDNVGLGKTASPWKWSEKTERELLNP